MKGFKQLMFSKPKSVDTDNGKNPENSTSLKAFSSVPSIDSMGGIDYSSTSDPCPYGNSSDSKKDTNLLLNEDLNYFNDPNYATHYHNQDNYSLQGNNKSMYESLNNKDSSLRLTPPFDGNIINNEPLVANGEIQMMGMNRPTTPPPLEEFNTDGKEIKNLSVSENNPKSRLFTSQPSLLQTPRFSSPLLPSSSELYGSATNDGKLRSESDIIPLRRTPDIKNSDNIDGIKPEHRILKRNNSSRLETSKKDTEFNISPLPEMGRVLPSKRPKMFLLKLEQCNIIFNFDDPADNLYGKEIKRMALHDLTEYITFKGSDSNSPSGLSLPTSSLASPSFTSNPAAIMTPYIYQKIIETVSINIFRPIPPPVNPIGEIYDPLEDEPIFEPAWPHLQLVYKFFLKFIESPNFNQGMAKPYITEEFVHNLLLLFDSEDPREREYLKTILHRLYGKFLSLRAFIRKSINNIFFEFIYETDRFNGTAELLEILGSIINGFAVPLKPEHVKFFEHVLIPLHKVKSVALFHPQLSYCIVQFLEKDQSLSYKALAGLIRFWPKCNSSKQVLVLNEIEDIIQILVPSEFERVQSMLFGHLAKCIASPHFQVAERVLHFWQNEYLVSWMMRYNETVLPILFEALYENCAESIRFDSIESKNPSSNKAMKAKLNHSSRWKSNSNIHQMARSALKLFMEANPDLFNCCLSEHIEKETRGHQKEVQRAYSWKLIEDGVKNTTKPVKGVKAEQNVYT
ncbi:protein phosphatase 2A regulatory B subunit [Nadsonia fulvescens var. elongata DSM 6958]|uniref:Serine/threonine-protein phosphatase 2A 56 kDa regulatory subunit n=1 Tax=Nadsonia fulvescens var. elongata DSM 6958 TaxID=857566 RepID=A0A1E3PFK6_9ASCO|nr:protein phosphatase 2A regulatory B subunit [Nadsonia fulvescens var. elongata DSM 6958]